MAQAIFGKDITRSFTADDGQAAVLLPTQAPTIYIFSTYPTLDGAQNGTGAVATISTWQQSLATGECTYTIPAIADPYPESAFVERDYFEAINYILQTSGQTQTKIRGFSIRRADALESIPGTTPADIKAAWPHVNAYITDAQLEKAIGLAEIQVRHDLAAKGYTWGRIFNLADTRIGIAFKAIEMAAAGEMSRNGAQEKFAWMVNYFAGKYADYMGTIKLPMDKDGDGVADITIDARAPYQVITR